MEKPGIFPCYFQKKNEERVRLKPGILKITGSVATSEAEVSCHPTVSKEFLEPHLLALKIH